jgi:phage terminase large subunit
MPSSFKVAEGGRGGGKSYTYAIMCCILAIKSKKKILCVRQFESSLSESVYPLIQEMANKYFSGKFTFYKDRIETSNGSKIIFSGLDRNIGSIKSIPNIDICWIEEGSYIKASAWDILVPTIMRNRNAEIWVSMNFDNEDDIIFREFFDKETLKPLDRKDTLYCHINYYDNPFISEKLIELAHRMRKNDYDKYLHIYEGGLNKVSEAQILSGKWFVDNFKTPDNVVFYHGLDFGFSIDPNVWSRCFIIGRDLYIDKAEYSYKTDYEELIKRMEKLPWKTWKTWKTYADSARPEGAYYLHKKGYEVSSVGGKSSIEAGIEFLRSFDKIIIHESLKELINEAKNWKYKIDPRTGDITPIIIDKHNHGWDSIRYALKKLIAGNGATINNQHIGSI